VIIEPLAGSRLRAGTSGTRIRQNLHSYRSHRRRKRQLFW